VARLEDLALEALTAAHQVANALVLLGGDVDEDQAIIAEVAPDLDGIAAVGLAVLPRPTRNERGRGEVALDAPLGQRTLEHVAGAGGLVAGPNGTLRLEALEVATQLTQVVRQSVDPKRLSIAVAEDGGRDGILVDV